MNTRIGFTMNTASRENIGKKQGQPDRRLKNSYYLMRHGRSLANEEGIIISSPDNGCSGWGLADRGREQIRIALQKQNILDRETLIYCSDFKRTRESADLAAEILGTPPPLTTVLLRERNFGSYEKTEDKNYQKVWDKDVDDPENSSCGVESPRQVRDRFLALLAELEERYKGRNILLVSHGDILQIALTWAEKRGPETHRSLKHLETAEIRAYNPV